MAMLRWIYVMFSAKQIHTFLTPQGNIRSSVTPQTSESFISFFHLYIMVNSLFFLKAYHPQKAARLDVKFSYTKLATSVWASCSCTKTHKTEQSLCHIMPKRQLMRLQFCAVTHAFTLSQISGFNPRQFHPAFLSFYG